MGVFGSKRMAPPRFATFGAAATDNRPDLVPQDLRRRQPDFSIDLRVLAVNARARHNAPGDLFSLVDGAKSVRVWLE